MGTTENPFISISPICLSSLKSLSDVIIKSRKNVGISNREREAKCRREEKCEGDVSTVNYDFFENLIRRMMIFSARAIILINLGKRRYIRQKSRNCNERKLIEKSFRKHVDHC